MEKWSICCTINVVIGSSSKRLLLVIVDSLLSLFNYFILRSLQSHVVVVVCTNTVRLHFYTLLCLLLYPQAKLFTMCRGYGTKKAVSFTPMDHNIQLVEPGLQSTIQDLSITVSQVLYQLFILHSFLGHQSQASCITFHPQSTLTQPAEGINLASCDQTGVVKLWNLEKDEPIADIEGHSPYRVSRLSFHPTGRFLGSAW